MFWRLPVLAAVRTLRDSHRGKKGGLQRRRKERRPKRDEGGQRWKVAGRKACKSEERLAKGNEGFPKSEGRLPKMEVVEGVRLRMALSGKVCKGVKRLTKGDELVPKVKGWLHGRRKPAKGAEGLPRAKGRLPKMEVVEGGRLSMASSGKACKREERPKKGEEGSPNAEGRLPKMVVVEGGRLRMASSEKACKGGQRPTKRGWKFPNGGRKGSVEGRGGKDGVLEWRA